jgi:glycosyltransferase involved in cell wall biosynthesis
VIAEEPSWRLTIAGDGPLRNDLETEAVRLGIAARVRFAGQLMPEGIRRELSQADALVLNSSYEGLPHVVLEAMSAGLPAVCSAAGGTPEIVRDGVTGLLFPHNDAFAFRTQMRRLMNDPQLRRRLIANARRMLDTSFSSEFMVESLESALKSTASSGSLWVSEPHTAHSSQRA